MLVIQSRSPNQSGIIDQSTVGNPPADVLSALDLSTKIRYPNFKVLPEDERFGEIFEKLTVSEVDDPKLYRFKHAARKSGILCIGTQRAQVYVAEEKGTRTEITTEYIGRQLRAFVKAFPEYGEVVRERTLNFYAQRVNIQTLAVLIKHSVKREYFEVLADKYSIPKTIQAAVLEAATADQKSQNNEHTQALILNGHKNAYNEKMARASISHVRGLRAARVLNDQSVKVSSFILINDLDRFFLHCNGLECVDQFTSILLTFN